MDIEKHFGVSVRKWREKLDITQETLSKRAGLNRTYICDIERGSRNVSLKNVFRIAEALAIPATELLADFGSQPPPTARLNPDQLADILLVEDDAGDIAATLEAMKEGGISNRVFVTRDGVAALSYLFCTGEFSHRRFDDLPQVVLLDISLPKLDGLEVLRAIRADVRTRALPVIVLTGSQAARDIRDCRRLGVSEYLMKPITHGSFTETCLKLHLQWALCKPVEQVSTHA